MIYFLGKWVLKGLFAIFLRLEVSGLGLVPARGPFILASNHRSYIDPLVVLVCVPRRLAFLVKATSYRMPLIRALFDNLGLAALRRQKGSPGMKQIVSYLRRGRPVMIFPEGTRNLTRRPFLPGQRGIGLAAHLAGAPVVPVYLGGTERVLPPRARMLRPGRVRIIFGRPINYLGEGYDAFAARVMSEISVLGARAGG